LQNMRISALVLLAIPATVALHCYQSGSVNVNGGDYTSDECKPDTATYCYSIKGDYNGNTIPNHLIVRNCDYGNHLCAQGAGTFPYSQTGNLGSGTITCCKENDCNPASSSSSLLMTILAAAAAAWQWR
ncbi:hypothetical protein PENTCL1PPCAC_25311, partial [Pristionchus entomophagus]